MIKLSIVPAQLPLLPDPIFSPGNQHLVGKVIVHASKPTTIGGLKLYWATTLQYRLTAAKRLKWGGRKVLYCAEVAVLDREQVVPAGDNEYEFMLALPADLLDTRTTHYDDVEHTLTAGLLKTSPCYDHIAHSASSLKPPSFHSGLAESASKTTTTTSATSRAVVSAFRRLRRAAQAHTGSSSSPSSIDDDAQPTDVFSGLPILACCSLRIPVFRTCCSIESDPTWRFSYTGVIPDFGAMYKLSMYTPNLAVGGILDVTLSLEDIPPQATLHAIDLALVQETTASASSPTCNGGSGECSEPDSTLDEYALWSVGQAWLTFPGRARPKAGSCLYRGAEARALDVPAQMDSGPGAGAASSMTTTSSLSPSITTTVTSKTTTTASSEGTTPDSSPPTFKTRLHLPSPIIGALPTLEVDTQCTAIATITHSLRLTFHYSLLGQDWSSADLPPDKAGLPVEGAIRKWSLEKEVIMGSDTCNAGQTAPPGYKRCAPGGRPRIGLEPSLSPQGPVVPSADIARRSSYTPGGRAGGRKWLRGVVLDPETLWRRTREHWEETEGLCECFCDGRDGGLGEGTGLGGAAVEGSARAEMLGGGAGKV